MPFILNCEKYGKESDIHARTWPAWYYLIRIRATDKFDTRARAARVASLGRKVENALVILRIHKSARREALKIFH